MQTEREIHKYVATLRTAATVTKRVWMEYMHVRIHVAIVKVCIIIGIIIIIIIITAIEFSLGDSSPYTSRDKTNKNKYT